MKANILSTGILASVFSLMSVSIFAQWTPPALPASYVSFKKAGEGVDTVTVDSRMPYKLTAPTTSVPDLDYQYKWSFETTGSVVQSWPMMNMTIPTGTAITPVTAPDLYTQNEISVRMPSTPGQFQVRTAIQSLFKGAPLCSSIDTVASILVVAKPSLAWGRSDTAVCYAATMPDMNIHRVALTGYGQWEIEYEITSTDLLGGNASASVTVSKTIGVTGNTVGNYLLNVEGAKLTRTNPENGGIYKIKILKLTDRFSRKSLDEVVGIFPTGTTAAFTIYVLPAPTTQKLQHVKNI
jgi:hypothetical protein